MVCGNEEELGAPIGSAGNPRHDVDANLMLVQFALEFPQVFALGECPVCQISLLFSLPSVGINSCW
jgi:hypothetical protein